MLESKINQFYHPRSEDSLQSTHRINQGGFFGALVAGFAFISRDYYFGTPSDDCFCNVKKIFLTTIMYMTTRNASTAAKNSHRISLKRYLINRSSRVLLIFFILICQNCLDQGGNSCYFKEKGSWLLPKFIQIITQSLSRWMYHLLAKCIRDRLDFKTLRYPGHYA